MVLSFAGCYAPLHSHGVAAASLPDTYRMACRTGGPLLNYAGLALPAQSDFVLGPGDIIEVTLYRLNPDGTPGVVRVQVMSNGEIHLPVVGGVQVSGKTLVEAQAAITKVYGDDILKQPGASVFLIERSSASVLVLGEVRAPGAYRLPKGENDVAHALATAGGLSENAGMVIEIHRRIVVPRAPPPANDLRSNRPSPELIEPLPAVEEMSIGLYEMIDPTLQVLRIPLRGFPQQPLAIEDMALQHGDLVIVPGRRDEIFFVVGKLSPNNAVRFSLGREERELGAGYLLPRDREVDVVTAVCMAGYIDPIDSPTTVTVQRMTPDGRPILIKVDLIAARYDFRENLLVQPGDIIYLNPDAAWWTRRTFDRIIPSLFSLSYRKWLNLGGSGSDN